MIPQDPEHVLDEISREHLRPELNLLPGVIAGVRREDRRLKVQRRIGFAILTLALVFSGLYFTVPGVANAVRSLFGYIPGVGRVAQSGTIRVLAGPVHASRDGFDLVVERAVLDANHTVITYRAAGAFPRWDEPSLRPVMCSGQPRLILPDGTPLANLGGEGSSNGTESTWNLIFAALPADVNRATLVLPCLPDLPAGEGPQEWAFSLEFVPAQSSVPGQPSAPAALTVYPVVNLPTTTPAAGNATAAPQVTAAPGSFTWILNSLAVLPDGYYLETTLGLPAGVDPYDVTVYPDALHLTDAAGQEAPVWQLMDGSASIQAVDSSMPLNLQAGLLTDPGPARLTLDYLGAGRPAANRFSFDVGSDPQPGQVWPIDRDLTLGSHTLRVISAQYVESAPGEAPALRIDLAGDRGILAVFANDLEHETLDSGGVPASDRGPMQVVWHYRDAFPRGTITVTISRITERVDGPWTVDWTPTGSILPTVPPLPTIVPTLKPELARCPADRLLETAADELPAGLGGRVAYIRTNGDQNELFVSNLDGSEVSALGPGAFPDLSPDGQKVLYRGADEGIYMRDLTTGTETLIYSSGQPDVYDNWPRWSPDGSRIAFYRIANSRNMGLFVMDADGANLRPLTSGRGDAFLIGWSADGTGLYYRLSAEAGQSVQLLDLNTGESREIAPLPHGTLTATLSPDSRRLLYLTGQALWLDRLDGSPAEALIATSGHLLYQINPLWSPDGNWVVLNDWETPGEGQPGLALLEVADCRFVHLTGHPGNWISDWVMGQ